VTGKQVWATLGSAGAITIAEARERGRTALQRIRDGFEPFEPTPEKPATFEEVATLWFKRHVQAKKLRSSAEIARCLERYVYPAWRNTPFTGIRRSQVATLLDAIEDKNGPRQADAVRAILSGVANWYASRHDDYVNPLTRGMRRQPAAQRDRILSDEEIRAIWGQAMRAGTFGAIVRFALLTGQRREKVASLRWSDLQNGIWTIPEFHREKGTGGSLKLPAAALAIIEAQPRLETNPFVFAGRGDGPFNGFSKAKAALAQALPRLPGPDGQLRPIVGWTIHDLRRTARSLMARAGVRPDVAERVLGHAIVGVAAIYDRHHYEEEKAEAIAKLAALIERITTPTQSDSRLPCEAAHVG
jgi:integrase